MGSMFVLSEIATITSGYTFRSALSILPAGDKPLIRPSDLDNYNEENLGNYQLDAPTIHLDRDDILLSIKGKFRAALVKCAGEYVVPSSIFVIKAKGDDILAPYLLTFLNSRTGQSALALVARGSNIPALSKSALGTLKIPNPAIDMQKLVVEIAEYTNEYKRLTDEKINAMDGLINRLMKEGKINESNN